MDDVFLVTNIIRGLSSSICLLHIFSCPSDNAALERLVFVNAGGSYKCFVLVFFLFFYDACKFKRQAEDNIEIQSSIVEAINTEERQYGPIQR